MKRVVIVGMGFGGLNAARALAGKGLEVLLLDRHNYHLFQPLLYQVATAGVEQENIVYPIRAIVRGWRDVRFQLAEVEGIDTDRRQLGTDNGPVDYDYLILAPGSVTNFYGLESAQQWGHDLKELGDAVAARSHILAAFEEAAREENPARRAALMTIAVVGAGPTGVELAGAVAELVRHAFRKDYPELRGQQARIVLVEGTDKVLSAFPESLQGYAARRLRRLGVEVILEKTVTDVQPGQVVLDGGIEIPCYTLLWAAGVKASPLAAMLPGPKARGGRVPVGPDLSVEGHNEVFVIGDSAYMAQDGAPLPMVAPVAIQQGKHVGRVILGREQGREVSPFRYHDRGSMAIIGRYAAVAKAYGVDVTGLPAWVTWLGLHLYYLIGFRNRLMALLNWAYAYLLVDPKLRLLVPECLSGSAYGQPAHRAERDAKECGGRGS